MKKVNGLILIMMLISKAGFAASKNTTLANPGDFIFISNVKENEVGIFLSYAGKHANKCGIALRSSSFILDGKELDQVLQIQEGFGESGTNIAVVENNKLVAKMADPEQMLFGVFYKINTKTNTSIEQALLSLGTFYEPEVIAEAVPCE